MAPLKVAPHELVDLRQVEAVPQLKPVLKASLAREGPPPHPPFVWLPLLVALPRRLRVHPGPQPLQWRVVAALLLVVLPRPPARLVCVAPLAPRKEHERAVKPPVPKGALLLLALLLELVVHLLLHHGLRRLPLGVVALLLLVVSARLVLLLHRGRLCGGVEARHLWQAVARLFVALLPQLICSVWLLLRRDPSAVGRHQALLHVVVWPLLP